MLDFYRKKNYGKLFVKFLPFCRVELFILSNYFKKNKFLLYFLHNLGEQLVIT